MSRRNLGGFIRPGYNPLRVPNAPTIGTASQASATSVSVPFTAPSCVGGGAITGYTAVSSPGCKVATGASSPLTVGCLTTGTAYTFRVYATNSYGPSAYSASSNSVTPVAVGQQAYTTAGTYSWVAPAGVTSVSVVAVGPGGYGGGNGNCATGGGGGGGGLGYKNNISVTPGASYTLRVGSPDGLSLTGTSSYFLSNCTVRGCGGKGPPSLGCQTGAAGGSYLGTGGGAGGKGGNGFSFPRSGGGGGAGGYAGTGGAGGTATSSSTGTNGAAGTGGAGGGGAWDNGSVTAHGGGVGILGQGCSGAGGSGVNSAGSPGSGGSGRFYGGGSNGGTGNPGSGAVRIIWPGTSRQFPSTCTGDK